MAISFVGYATNTDTGSTIAVDINGTLTGGIGSSPQQGDLIIVIHGSAYNTLLTMSASGNNSGAFTTEVAAFRGNDSWDANLCISRQFAGATPDTTVTVSRGLSNAAYGSTAIVLVYRGVDSTTPMDVASTTATGINGSIADAPSLTPTTSGALILAVGNGAQAPASTAYTTPSGMTGIVSITGDGSTSDSTLIASSYAWTSGAYDPAVVGGGDSNASSSWSAATLALRPAASSGSSGTVAYTNAADTSSASGTTTVIGTLARTNAADTSSASGTTTVIGTSATTNANDTSSASGSPIVNGSSATTNENDTSSASGDVGGTISGTVAYTNANDTSSASGTTTVIGASAITNANDTASASGSPVVNGTVATTNDDDTATASGTSGSPTGTVAYTNNNDIANAQGFTPNVSGAARGSRARKRRYYAEINGKTVFFDDPQQFEQIVSEYKTKIRHIAKRQAKKIGTVEQAKQIEPPKIVLPKGVDISEIQRGIDRVNAQLAKIYYDTIIKEIEDEEEEILLALLL